MKTLSAIRIGYSDNLITRAADVTLKEHRRLVLVAREAPLSEIHLENMHYLACLGAVIFPPTVAYYARPTSVDEVTTYVVGRVIDQFGIEHSLIKRWKDDQHPRNGDRPAICEENELTTQACQTAGANATRPQSQPDGPDLRSWLATLDVRTNIEIELMLERGVDSVIGGCCDLRFAAGRAGPDRMRRPARRSCADDNDVGRRGAHGGS